ncbi:MAG: DsrE/DsrF/DrsH-like family protein [Promethearchaeota archaeon]
MTERNGKKRMAIIVSKSTMDMAYPPFILGVTGASMDMDVSVFFTFSGLNLLKKKGGADSVKLGGLMRIGTGMMKGRMKKAGAKALPEMIRDAKDLGAKLYACQMTMDVMNIKREDLIDEVDDVLGAAAFLNFAKDADITLFI